MTRTIHLRLAAVVDAEDETKCSAECPHRYGDWCVMAGERYTPDRMRHDACLAAEIKEPS
jgi:hypothetical protein